MNKYLRSLATALAFVASIGVAAQPPSSTAPGAAPPQTYEQDPVPFKVASHQARRLSRMAADERQAFLDAVAETATPAERLRLGGAPLHGVMLPPPVEDLPEPTIVPGAAAVKPIRASEAAIAHLALGSAETDADIAPQNYGAGNQNTPFHYSDHLLGNLAVVNPYLRRVGQWYFTFDGSGWFRCTASLISNSLLVTAGHCVHEGGNGADGWIQDGYFVPGDVDDTRPYREADWAAVATTKGWFNSANLAEGYDVAVVALNKPTGVPEEYGYYLGYNGFCTSNCMQNYWYLTQIGYPGNYYGGTKMTMGQHLELYDDAQSDGYVYGSGMQGGSSGGPHIANWGDLSDSARDRGQWASRNVVFAVTSWGYVDQSIKVQGSSPLTGTFGEDPNNFKGLFNQMCDVAQGLHGSNSCSKL